MALSRIFVAPKNGQGGVKKSKKIFFSEKIFERWEKKILGPLGPFLKKIDFLKSGGQGVGGVRSTDTSPRTITAFKKLNQLEIWIFQVFKHTRLGHFGLILGLKISKCLQNMAKE